MCMFRSEFLSASLIPKKRSSNKFRELKEPKRSVNRTRATQQRIRILRLALFTNRQTIAFQIFLSWNKVQSTRPSWATHKTASNLLWTKYMCVPAAGQQKHSRSIARVSLSKRGHLLSVNFSLFILAIVGKVQYCNHWIFLFLLSTNSRCVFYY